MIASVPASCSFSTLPSNFVFNRRVRYIVIRRIVCSTLHEQRGDFSIFHVWIRLLHIPWFNFVHNIIIRERSKPGTLCLWVFNQDDASYHRDFHISDRPFAGNSKSHIGCLDLSLFWRYSVISSCNERIGFLLIFSIIRSAQIILRRCGGAILARTGGQCIWVGFNSPYSNKRKYDII